jgi:integrase
MQSDELAETAQKAKSRSKGIKLTHTALKAKREPGRYSIDGHRGLYMWVGKSGQRAWMFRSKAGGEMAWRKLAPVIDLGSGEGWDHERATAEAARLRADTDRRRTSGAEIINPIVVQRAEARAAKEAEKQRKALEIARSTERANADALRPTLNKVAEKYLGVFVAAKRRRDGAKRSKDADQRVYDRDIAPHMGQMKVEDIRTKHVSGLRDLIVSESGKRHALRLLSSLLSHAKSDGLIEFNPARGVATSAPRQRERVLTHDECKAIWAAKAIEGAKAADDKSAVEGVRATVLAAIKVQLATGQRAGEVLAMRWSDLRSKDRDHWWVVPAEIAKNGKEHLVPLSPQVRALIDAQQAARDADPAKASPYVFAPHRAKGAMSTSAYAQVVDRVRDQLKLDHFTSHDLRRTCATRMAEAGTLPHVIEAVLNHSGGAKAGVAGIYNRASYFKETRDALCKWAKALDAFANDQSAAKRTKVVNIAAARPTT